MVRSKKRIKRPQITPDAGGGPHFPLAWKSIRFSQRGCTNRSFFHIVVMMRRRHQHEQPIEQIGSYDPLPNERNEKLVAINVERLRYWMTQKCTLSKPLAEVLGLGGLLPIHPQTYEIAWKHRMLRKKVMLDEQLERVKALKVPEELKNAETETKKEN